MKKEPLVSVITTVRNCEKFVAEAINSILQQTYDNIEYILVDDGSTDSTRRILNSYLSDIRVRLITFESNIGRIACLNNALAEASGEYIAIHDADDISFPDRLRKQVRFLERNKDYVLVASNVVEIDQYGKETGHPRKPVEDDDLQFSILFKCTLANPSTMFRKATCDENKIRYETRFIHAEDFGFISRLIRYGKVHNLEEILLKYRRHTNNNSKVNFRDLDASSTEIARLNLWRLGLHLEADQVRRIRLLLSSKGISKEHILDDVSTLLRAVEIYLRKRGTGRYPEIEALLLRMQNWLGKKNLLLRPSYKKLNARIKDLRRELSSSRTE